MEGWLPRTVRSRLDPNERYGLRATLFGLAVVLAGVPFGFLLDQVVRKGSLVRYDTAAARALHHAVAGKRVLIWMLEVISFTGAPPFLTLISISAGAFLIWRKRYRLGAFLAVTAIGGSLIDSVVKIVVDRDRPSVDHPIITAHGQSFPSGHTMSSTYVYGALLLIFFPVIPKRWRAWAIAGWAFLVAAIGTSRLALGVHFITDVVGGAVLGLAWLTASTAAFSIWRTERGRKPVQPTRGLEPEARRDLSKPA
ncbi:MAG: phosphatase PAP2 family protein [Actinomycetota bacterium]|nr:phosphatase PAP2 family protein [Actinomycetota bacterium]